VRGFHTEPHTPGPGPLWLMVLPVVLLVGITLANGLTAEPSSSQAGGWVPGGSGAVWSIPQSD